MRHTQETKDKISAARTCKVKSICLNCQKEILAPKSRGKKYCSRECYRKHTDKPGGFKKGFPNLNEIWVRKYGEDEAKNKKKLLSKKLSAIHSELVNKFPPGKMRSRFGPDKTKGVSQRERMINKYGEKEGLHRYGLSLEKLSKASTGRIFTVEVRQKIRLARIKGIEQRIKKPLSPRYNPEACRFIESYGRETGLSFRHAESHGGEYHLPIGFYLDGYDQNKNTVIEYYERYHFDGFGNLKKRDQLREDAIIKHLNCAFIRVNAFDINNIKIEQVR